MTKEEINDLTRAALSDRIRSAVKAVLEQVIEEEMTEHIATFAADGDRSRSAASRED